MNINIPHTEYSHLLECKEELEKRKFREYAEARKTLAEIERIKANKPTGMILSSDTEVKFTSLTDTIDRATLERYGTALKNHCSLCLSTSHRKGWFGERVCDNKQCENSKSKFL